MVQIPTYEARVGLDAPAYPTPRVDDSVGQALQSVGGAISSLASHIQARDKQKADFDARIGYETLQAQLDQGLAEISRGAPADGTGLHDSFMQKVYRPKATAYLASIKDPEIRGRMQAQIDQLGNEVWGSRAADAEYKLGNAYSLTQVQGMQESRLRGIAQDPTTLTAYTQEVDKLVDTAPNLTAAQREELKTKFREAAPGIVAEALATTDRETLKFALGNGTNDERIAFLTKRLTPAVKRAENAPGDPNAVSKDGAIGIMQVTPDAAVTVAEKMGDKTFLALSREQQIEALKNPATNEKFGQGYLAMQVANYGGDVEAALIAYNAGPGNADKWLKAGRDYSVLPRRSETEPYVQKVLGGLGTAQLASSAASRPTTDSKTPGRRIPIETGTQPGRQPLELKGLNPKVVDLWERTQGAFGRAVPVVSAFRDAATNAKAGGANKSEHMHGNALDIDVSGLSKAERVQLIETASAQGFTGIGVYNNSLHLDTGNRRAWGPSHHSDSVPPWAYTAVAKHLAGKSAPKSDAPGGEFVSPAFANMPVAELQRYRASLSTTDALEKERLKQQLEMLKVDTTRQMDDDIANIRQSGQSMVQPTDVAAFEEKIAQAHGIDRVMKYRDDRFVAQSIHSVLADAATTPDAALDDRIKAIETQPGEGAALRHEIAAGVKSEIESIKAERKADPVGYVLRHDPKVQAAWQSFSPENPNTAADAIRATIDAQKALGIAPEKVMPLPADKAQAVASVIKNPELPADQRAAALLSTILLTPDVDQQRQIVAQVVKAGLSPKVANVVEAYSRGDMGATMRLFQAAMTEPDKAPKLGSDDNKLSTMVEDAMLGEGTIGRVFYGFDLGDPQSSAVAASDLDLAKTAARISMAAGMSPDAAVQQAMTDIFGKVEVLDRDLPTGGRVLGLVDDGSDAEALARGLDKANGTIMDAINGYLARSFRQLPADASPELRAIHRATHSEATTRLFANGVWRNNGKGWSFFDPDSRAFVADAEGKPIVFSTEDILKMGGAKPALPAPPSLPSNAFMPTQPAPPDGEALKNYLNGLKRGGPAAAPAPSPPPVKIPPAPGASLQDQLKSNQSELMRNGPLRNPLLWPTPSPVTSKSFGG